MKRIRITHQTEYHYHQPVTFGPHRAMLRPREGHDVHIVKGQYEIEPKAAVRWLRDVHGNSVAVIIFSESSDRLVVASEVDVEFHGFSAQQYALKQKRGFVMERVDRVPLLRVLASL